MDASIRGSQPLKWHGGKRYLADRIIGLFPEHTHYVEPFFGGGSVLFQKPADLIEGHSEVVNDCHGDLVNFWRVLKGPATFAAFQRAVEATPFAQVEFEEAKTCRSDDPVERAVAFFVRFRQSRQGLGKDFATTSRSRTRRGMNEQTSSWLSAIEGLPQAHARLRRVVIFSEDAVRVIRREDSPSTFFYLDPPYLAETRAVADSYDFEMTGDQHVELLECLSRLEGKFALSGYPSKLYDDFAKRNGWRRIDFAIDNKASSAKIKPIKTESLWLNYAAEAVRALRPSCDAATR